MFKKTIRPNLVVCMISKPLIDYIVSVSDDRFKKLFVEMLLNARMFAEKLA